MKSKDSNEPSIKQLLREELKWAYFLMFFFKFLTSRHIFLFMEFFMANSSNIQLKYWFNKIIKINACQMKIPKMKANTKRQIICCKLNWPGKIVFDSTILSPEELGMRVALCNVWSLSYSAFLWPLRFSNFSFSDWINALISFYCRLFSGVFTFFAFLMISSTSELGLLACSESGFCLLGFPNLTFMIWVDSSILSRPIAFLYLQVITNINRSLKVLVPFWMA